MKTIIVNSERRGTKEILVDDDDYDRLKKYNWNIKLSCNTFYAEYTFYKGHLDGRNKSIKMHRFILGLEDPEILVDHKDRNGLNNQKDNLRICSHSQNAKNIGIKKSGKVTSKYKGVTWAKSRNRWLARCTSDNVTYYCGKHKKEIDAAIAYDTMAKKLHGEFSSVNFQ